MKRSRNLRLLAAAALALTASGCSPADPRGHDAWISLPRNPGEPATLYFRVYGGWSPERLISVTTPVAKRAEMRETVERSSHPIGPQTVARETWVKFQPGGKYVALYDIAPITEGQTVRVELHFSGDYEHVEQMAARVHTAADTDANFRFPFW